MHNVSARHDAALRPVRSSSFITPNTNTNTALDEDERAASSILDATVRFVRDDAGKPIRGTAGDRWLSRVEWRLLRHEGLVSEPWSEVPSRAAHDHISPCSGCERDDEACLCTRLRLPVRIALRRSGPLRADVELRRGGELLAVLGTWDEAEGWDFSRAGDAKAASLPRVIGHVIERERRRLPALSANESASNDVEEACA